MFTVEVYEQHLKGAWCCARNGFPQHCSLSGDQEVQLQQSNHIKSAPPLDAGDLGWRWLRLSLLNCAFLVTMASSDGLDEECVLQRGRSQSDPSSITEVRLGEAHRAGKRRGGGGCICHVITRWLGRKDITVSGLACKRSHPRWSHWICMQQT